MIHVAAHYSHNEQFIQFLLDNGADVNQINSLSAVYISV